MIPWALTYFSDDYYEAIGRDSLASLARHWPGKIVAYHEDAEPAEKYQNVEYRDLLAVPGYQKFIGWASQVPFLNGRLMSGKDSFHYDVVRFVRRIYAMTHKPEGRFYVVDADVILEKPIPADLLNGWLDGKLGALIQRGHLGMPVPYPELSVSGWNMEHRDAEKFMLMYLGVHDNGTFLKAQAGGFHDAWIMHWLIEQIGLSGEFTDWTKGQRGADELGVHVFPLTPLAEYMKHYKGTRAKREYIASKEAA